MKNQSLRILVLSPIEPYPPHTGWHVVIYNDIKYLAARGHELTVLALTHQKEASANDLADIATAEYFLIAKPPRWRQVMANFGNHLPYSIVRQHDERLLARASELVRSGKIDVVLIEDVIMWRASRSTCGGTTSARRSRGDTTSRSTIQSCVSWGGGSM